MFHLACALLVAALRATSAYILVSTLTPVPAADISAGCTALFNTTGFVCVSEFDNSAFWSSIAPWASPQAQQEALSAALEIFGNAVTSAAGKFVNITAEVDLYQDLTEGVVYSFATQYEAVQGAVAIAYARRLSQLPTKLPTIVSEIQVQAPYHLSFLNSKQRQACVVTPEYLCQFQDDAYVFAQSGLGVRLYVVGTQIDGSNSEFLSRLGTGSRLSGDAFLLRDASDSICSKWQGTHVAGVAAGVTFGVAKDSEIFQVAVKQGCGQVTELSDFAEGLQWIAAHHSANPAPSVIVITTKFAVQVAAPLAVQLIESLVSNLVEAGIVVVAAAGAESTDACAFTPPRMPSVITVAAAQVVNLTSKTTGFPWVLSNVGACIDIWAPGDRIEAAYPDGASTTAVYGGTSQAAAMVAGLAATVLQKYPTGNQAFVYAYLKNASTTGYLVYSPPNTVDFIAQQVVE